MTDPQAPRAIPAPRRDGARTDLARRYWPRLPRSAHCAWPLGLLVLCACAAPAPIPGGVQPRPLGRDLTTIDADPPAIPALARNQPAQARIQAGGAATPAAPTGPLELREALAFALRNSPRLAAFAWALRAADARVLQASLRPNPELDAEVENFGGSGIYSGFDAAEITALLRQPILTGGERAKRTRVARLERRLAGWDYEAARLDLFTEVVQRYIDVLAAQRERAVARKSFMVAQQVYETVASQVAAGAVSPIEQTRAKTERALSRIDLQTAERALAGARQTLAETLGLADPRFDEVVGVLGPVRPVPALERLQDFLPSNPAVARWQTVLEAHRARIELAEAEGLPDITPGIGVRHFQQFDDTAAVATITLPLPLFDRNQGNIAAARAALAQARAQRRAAIVALRAELARRHQELQSAATVATTLAEEALPAARTAFEAVRTAYRRGQRGFLDVLVAQRTLFEVEDRYVKTLAQYHRTAAAVERLIARPLVEKTAEDATHPEDSTSAADKDDKEDTR